MRRSLVDPCGMGAVEAAREVEGEVACACACGERKVLRQLWHRVAEGGA